MHIKESCMSVSNQIMEEGGVNRYRFPINPRHNLSNCYAQLTRKIRNLRNLPRRFIGINEDVILIYSSWTSPILFTSSLSSIRAATIDEIKISKEVMRAVELFLRNIRPIVPLSSKKYNECWI